jgi:predicted nucleotidyltransferase
LTLPNLGIILPTLGRSYGVKMTSRTDTSLGSALFSGVQQRLLALIFGHPERSFYMSEIVRQLRSGTGAVERELTRLQKSGLVSIERIGNQKHYRANPNSPIFNELHGIIQKTVGLKEPLQRALQDHADQIKIAFVYGSVAKQSDTANSDIDLMVIGDGLVYSDLYLALQAAEKTIGRPVNPSILDLDEWKKRQENNSFIQKVVSQPKIFIFGSEADL